MMLNNAQPPLTSICFKVVYILSPSRRRSGATRAVVDVPSSIVNNYKLFREELDVTCRLSCVCLFCMLFFVDSVTLFAGEAVANIPPDMTPEKLEKTVKLRFKYVDKRLLSGKSAKEIEESGNQQAIDILRHSRGSRDKIADWIIQGRYEDAYIALQELGRSMKEAMRLSRARELGAKKIKNDLDSARIENDTYFELIKKRADDDVVGELAELIEQARDARVKADELKKNNDFQGATEYFLTSTRLLKKATSSLRDIGR